MDQEYYIRIFTVGDPVQSLKNGVLEKITIRCPAQFKEYITWKKMFLLVLNT